MYICNRLNNFVLAKEYLLGTRTSLQRQVFMKYMKTHSAEQKALGQDKAYFAYTIKSNT